MPLLNSETLQSQLSSIDLLAAMFPSEGELEMDASTKECIERLWAWCEDPDSTPTPSGVPSSLLLAVYAPVSGGRTIQVNVSIPMHSDSPESEEPPQITYSLRQPDWISKATLAKLSAAMPSDDIFSALDYLQEEASTFLSQETPPNPPPTSLPDSQPENQPLVRVWFYFPSLSTRAKRTDMVTYAPDHSLTGFVLAGKPGVLCLEGQSRDIDAYMSFIKTHSWGDIPAHQKKVSERYRETEVQRVFEGMEEITDSLGERGGARVNRGDMQALEGWLGAKGLGEAFERVIF